MEIMQCLKLSKNMSFWGEGLGLGLQGGERGEGKEGN